MEVCNAPAMFQTLTNLVSYYCLYTFVVLYLDSLLIFSKTKSDHISDLETFLSRLEAGKL